MFFVERNLHVLKVLNVNMNSNAKKDASQKSAVLCFFFQKNNFFLPQKITTEPRQNESGMPEVIKLLVGLGSFSQGVCF